MDKALDAALVWFRRDLRVADHAALYHALKAARRVFCAFIFDTDILDPLPQGDRRVEFIHESCYALDRDLRELGLEHGHADAGLVFGHGPGADELADAGIALHTSKDCFVFERNEILTLSGKPYGVFTPYKNVWLEKLDAFFMKAYPVERYADALAPVAAADAASLPTLQALGFEPTSLHDFDIHGGSAPARALLDDFTSRIDDYETARNYPGVKGPSYLSVHLRFGTISIRELVRTATRLIENPSAAGPRGAQVWLSELIWRDFYQQVLAHHPHTVDASFKPEFDRVRFEHGKHADELFDAWCRGATGYPLVDAAMAQINQTGYMHNRLRMVTASFLVKDLGIDWRRGERYFAEKLNDYDLGANVGGWQWAASTGADPQPFFRIFNPVRQSEKFDPEGKFIRRYLPQLERLGNDLVHAPWLARPIDLESAGLELGRDYPLPIVDHDEARRKTLARYAVVKEKS
jgi:deoxyribodipyrimidine photo-lyase